MLPALLMSLPLIGSAQSGTAGSETPKAIAASSEAARRSAAYTGYSVDGRTSASVLAAKRSHTVSKEDETGLAVYSGLIVIGLIVFFAQGLIKRK